MKLFGIEIAMPAGWTDHTVHRFSAPREAQMPLGPTLRKAQEPFRANVSVAEQPLPAGVTLETFLHERNRAFAGHLQHFAVLATGTGTYSGRPAAWQDLTHVDPRSGLRIFQRQIAIEGSASGMCVLLTLTSDKQALDAFGFSVS